VRELWLVDEHNGTIEVRTLENERLLPGEVHSGSEKVQSTVLQGFSFAATQIFSD
jgi:Uma2 family endonuclease